MQNRVYSSVVIRLQQKTCLKRLSLERCLLVFTAQALLKALPLSDLSL